MARIIGEASIRLTADGKTLAAEFKTTINRALREAVSGIDMPRFNPASEAESEAERSGGRVRGILNGILGAGRAAGQGLASALAGGARFVLMATQAGLALAAVSSLATGIAGLVGVTAQAAGVLGLLPAAFIAIKAVSATLKLALDGVGESFSALASGDAAAFQESLKGLAPAARAFVTEVAKIKPAFDKIKLNLQQTAFEGLSKSVAPLATRYLPIMDQFFQAIGQSANEGAQSLLTFANNGETAGQVRLFAQDIATAFNQLMPALAPAASALLDIGQTGAEFLTPLTQTITNLSIRFAEFIRNAAASGQLTEFFQNAIDTVKQLGTVIKNVFSILYDVFSTAQAVGGGFLNTLVQVTNQIKAFTSSSEGQTALVNFFTAMREIIGAVIPVVVSLARTVGTELAPILADMARTIGPAFLPVVDALGPALRAAAPGIKALAEGFAEFLKGIAPLVPVIGQIAGIVGGALGAVFKALAPVLVQVANALEQGLATILPQLMPVIQQTATAIGQVFTALVPLIPVFFQLLGAILPILPPLLQLVAQLLPPLVQLIQTLAPIVTALANVFAAAIPILSEVAQTVLGILLPPIQLIATVVSNVATIVSNVFSAMSGFISTVMGLIGSVISGIWGSIVNTFTGALRSIGDFVNNAFTKVRTLIGDAMGNIGRAVSDGIQNVIRFFRDLPGNILSAIGDFGRLLWDAGVQLLEGLWNGIKSMISTIFNRVKQFVVDLKDGFLSLLGINSPSKVFREYGVYLMQGLDVGIKDGTGAVLDTVDGVARDVIAGMNPLTNGLDVGVNGLVSGGDGATLGGAAAGGMTIVQHNTMLPGADVQQFANEVWRRGAAELVSVNSTLTVSQRSVQTGMAAPGSIVNLGG